MRVWLRCRRAPVLVLALGLALVGLTRADAQQFPTKPITIVVPAAPGGVTDLIARALGQQFTESFGQPVVVEDKPGATNQIAAEYVAHSAADGYTLLVSPEATFVINPYLFQKLSYDPAKDFVPVSGLISIEQALIGSPQLQASNVADLIALAKRQPGALNYGTFGVGSTGHLNMEMLESKAGVRFVPIHYKGATPALADVLAGHIQMMFISVGSAVEPWRAGKIKMLAIGGEQRLARLPEMPTIAEAGMPGFEAVSWFGLFAPTGTPPAIVDILNKQTQQTLSDPKFRATVLEPQFFEAMTGSPQDFAAFIKSDAEKWSGVIRAANVKVE
jgi:tripartite-type tricarboxylate transporter receptor subunit TctC